MSRRDETQELLCASPSGAWLMEVTTPAQSSVVRIERGQNLILGSADACDVLIGDPTVSARHAELCWGEDGLEVRDLDSTNGLRVGSARVRGAKLLASGSHFQLGRTLVVLRSEEPDEAEAKFEPVPGIVGNSAAMRRVALEIRRAAPLKAPVLVVGESGTGKDLVATALHQLSQRGGMLVPLNMGSLTEGLADADLFGHTRGAFTGAIAQRSGAFVLAHGGTLFLDEIADLSPGLQVKLLRVVEDGRVRALGSTEHREVDVRVVSATWANLHERVEQGRFREDLLHRISTLLIRLPPLRQRKSDIAALSRTLLARYAVEFGELNLTDAALSGLMSHDWPGNVRQLGSVLYRCALMARAGTITAPDVAQAIGSTAQRAKPVASPVDALRVLKQHGGNVSAAARALRVPRSTFRAWLERAENSAA
ncbi:MAG: sigma 54-interacting transcriptional regulator [Myxococcales bacterium]|nr:sigma 54-interacting transcriptional regulator [Myxococcales bacterium]